MFGSTIGDRAHRSDPIFKVLVEHGMIGQTMIPGAVAGTNGLPAIRRGDRLVSVLAVEVDVATTDADIGGTTVITSVTQTMSASDVTDEFTVQEGHIDNTGGTDLSGFILFVTWEKWGTTE